MLTKTLTIRSLRVPESTSAWGCAEMNGVRVSGRVFRCMPFLRGLVCTVVLVGGFLFFPAHLNATSVVALIDRTNNKLVIAADCRVDRDSGSRAGCKIINEAGRGVALEGLYAEKS